MGAVANMRPDLFKGVIAEVPFVDALNTILDDTLPLTPPEWFEWGNPITDAEAFQRIQSYSPYDNVKAQGYPAMLVLAGLTDPRVHLLGAGEMGGEAAREKNRRQSALSPHQYGCGPWRRCGAVRSSRRSGANLRLRAQNRGSRVSLSSSGPAGRQNRRRHPRRSG